MSAVALEQESKPTPTIIMPSEEMARILKILVAKSGAADGYADCEGWGHLLALRCCIRNAEAVAKQILGHVDRYQPTATVKKCHRRIFWLPGNPILISILIKRAHTHTFALADFASASAKWLTITLRMKAAVLMCCSLAACSTRNFKAFECFGNDTPINALEGFLICMSRRMTRQKRKVKIILL